MGIPFLDNNDLALGDCDPRGREAEAVFLLTGADADVVVGTEEVEEVEEVKEEEDATGGGSEALEDAAARLRCLVGEADTPDERRWVREEESPVAEARMGAVAIEEEDTLEEVEDVAGTGSRLRRWLLEFFFGDFEGSGERDWCAGRPSGGAGEGAALLPRRGK